jgi:hypothetical protein
MLFNMSRCLYCFLEPPSSHNVPVSPFGPGARRGETAFGKGRQVFFEIAKGVSWRRNRILGVHFDPGPPARTAEPGRALRSTGAGRLTCACGTGAGSAGLVSWRLDKRFNFANNTLQGDYQGIDLGN